jgi:hypothetical protein
VTSKDELIHSFHLLIQPQARIIALRFLIPSSAQGTTLRFSLP